VEADLLKAERWERKMETAWMKSGRLRPPYTGGRKLMPDEILKRRTEHPVFYAWDDAVEVTSNLRSRLSNQKALVTHLEALLKAGYQGKPLEKVEK
jgi:hypothetical protein